jgi:hypothetical protein
LDERFNSRYDDFIRAVLKDVLKTRLSELYSGKLLPAFKQILIRDSTEFIVPPALEGNCRGGDGDAKNRSGTGVSIRYEFDLKSGEVSDFNLPPGIRNDRRDAGESAENVQSSDSIIRDSGCFSTPVFEKCAANQAFFLSRLDCGTNVYDKNYQFLCFRDIYRQMRKGGIGEKEMSVFTGKETKLGVRLLLQPVPEEVYEKRIREKQRKSKDQGCGQLSEETKTRCRFNLVIINAKESILSIEEFLPLYCMRWQIELTFKVVTRLAGFARRLAELPKHI